MPEVGAGGLGEELVAEGAAVEHGALRDVGDAVEPRRPRLRQAVPVDGLGVARQPHLHVHPDRVPSAHLQQAEDPLRVRGTWTWLPSPAQPPATRSRGCPVRAAACSRCTPSSRRRRRKRTPRRSSPSPRRACSCRRPCHGKKGHVLSLATGNRWQRTAIGGNGWVMVL